MGELEYLEMRIDSFKRRVSKRKTKRGCILWKGAINKQGYGQTVLWLNNERIAAHRLSYIINRGEFNRKLNVCHKCDNPSCVNPDHLFLGTAKDNVQDMIKKGRRRLKKKRRYNKLITI